MQKRISINHSYFGLDSILTLIPSLLNTMSESREYSLAEVMNFTIKDIQRPKVSHRATSNSYIALMIVLMSHSLSKLCVCASERPAETDARAASKLHLAASVWISHNRLHSHVQLYLANTPIQAI